MSNSIDMPAIADMGGEQAETAVGPNPASESAVLRRQQAVVAMGRRASAPPDPLILIQDAAALLAEILECDLYGGPLCLPRTTPSPGKYGEDKWKMPIRG
jgi:hypothetical protein